MVIYEDLGNGLVRAYSDAGMMIHGGYPEADYPYAEDPVDAGRTYVETDIPIPAPEDEEEATAEDYEEALADLGVE